MDGPSSTNRPRVPVEPVSGCRDDTGERHGYPLLEARYTSDRTLSTDDSFTASCSVFSFEVVVETTKEVYEAQSVHQRERTEAHVLEFER